MEPKRIDHKHPEYQDAKREEDCYKGGKNFQGKDYLWSLPLEKPPSQHKTARDNRFTHYNWIRLIVNGYTGALASQKQEIIAPTIDPSYLANVDGKGTSVKVQMEVADSLSYRGGMCYLLIDQPPVPIGISMAEEKANYRKRIKVLPRKSVYDWECDHNGNLTYASICTYYEGKEIITHYKDDGVIRYQKIDGEWVMYGEPTPNPFAALGYIPLKPVWAEEIESFIVDLVTLNIRLDNLKSIQDYLIIKGSVIIPEMADGTKVNMIDEDMVYFRGLQDSAGIQFKSPNNPILPDVKLEADTAESTLRTLASINKTEKSLVAYRALAIEQEEQLAVIKAKAQVLAESYEWALKHLEWWDNNGSKSIDQIAVSIRYIFPDSATDDNDASPELLEKALMPGGSPLANKLIYRSLVTSALSGKASTEELEAVKKDIMALPDMDFLSPKTNFEPLI